MNVQTEVRALCEALGLKLQCGGHGLVSAKIVIIAEAPGHNEVVQQMPLVGGSGMLLWDVLRKNGIKRGDCYVTNVIKRQKIEDERITPSETEAWIQVLKKELSLLTSARYYLILGGAALYAITGHSKIEQWRGSVSLIGDGTTHVYTYNPAHLFRATHLESMFRLDIGKFAKVCHGEYEEHKIVPHFDPSPSEAIRYCQRLRLERKPISFDIESNPTERVTLCVGLANNAHEGMCINFRDAHRNRYSIPEETAVRRAIAETLSAPSTQLVAQNGNFDAYWLWYCDGIKVAPIWFDTLLAHHTLYSTLPHDLGFLVAQYSMHPYYKDEKDLWKEGGSISDFWAYNVKDACLTWHIHQPLLAELKQQGLDKFFFDHVMHLQSHLVEMTVTGIRVDTEMKQRITEELQVEIAKLDERFNAAVAAATGDGDLRINPGSPKQLQNLYFNKLRLMGKGTSTDKTNRQWMRINPRTTVEARAVLDAQDALSKETKFLSTYANSRLDEDQRIRCTWKQAGTTKAPGRLSSAETAWGTGMNMQNQPERARGMYIADPGYVWFYFDLSQAEARYVGWDAGIAEWIEQFERARADGSFDCHRALAERMFNVPYNEVPTKDYDESTGTHTIRYVAKRCRHGLNYRMGPERLSEVTKLPTAEAQAAYQLYHKINPELRQWWARLEQEVRAKRVLYNSYGRCLRILGKLVDDQQLESIVAFRPQSSIGDKVSKVIYQCHEDKRWPTSARILLNIHDALAGLAHPSDAKRCLSIAVRYAEEPIIVNGKELIIPAEPKISVPDEHGMHRLSKLEKVTL